MAFYQDWQFWFAIINLAGLVMIGTFNWLSHHKIVGNDLHHLAIDVKEISTLQKEQGTKIGKLAEDVSYLKGRTETQAKKTYAKKKLKA